MPPDPPPVAARTATDLISPHFRRPPTQAHWDVHLSHLQMLFVLFLYYTHIIRDLAGLFGLDDPFSP